MRRCARTLSFIALVALIGGVCTATDQEVATWPQWRGPTRDGQVQNGKWPDKLKGKALTQLWRKALGSGYSSPIVATDRVFVFETQEKTTEVVRALNRKTGAELWTHSWPGAMKVPAFAAAHGDWVRATPAYDGASLFVAGMRDVLVCIDAASGKERWRVDFMEDFKTPLPGYGFASSPLVEGAFVYVQAGAGFVKLDKKTGKVQWRVLVDAGGLVGAALSSPMLATIHGRKQIVVQTRTHLVGVDMTAGQTLWDQEVPSFQGMIMVTPSVIGNSIFTSSYGGKSSVYDLAYKDGAFSVTTAWSKKPEGYMSTPVIINGHAYLQIRSQHLVCLDLKTGNETWRSDERLGKYVSLVACQDRILGLDERGILLLLKANPVRFEVLDQRTISEDPAYGHLAVCGNELFVRELNAIAAYRWE